MNTARTDHADLYFFDAHGGLWAACDCNDGRAQAFGPRGCARPVLAGAELEDLGFTDDGDNNPTLYVRARDAGRVLHADADAPTSWDLLLAEESEEDDPSFLDKDDDDSDAVADMMAVAGGTGECRGTPGPGGVELFAPLPERPAVDEEE